MSSSEAVRDCLIQRFRTRHLDLVPKYGIVAIMDAINERAAYLDNLEEIGSSDISCWMKDVIESLTAQVVDQ